MITGVSVGSLNAFGLALTQKGNFEEQANLLAELWSGLHQIDVFRSYWPFGILQGLFFGNSLFKYVIDDYLTDVVSRLNKTTLERSIMIGATNTSDGRLVIF